jgi:hypothetical protein
MVHASAGRGGFTAATEEVYGAGLGSAAPPVVEARRQRSGAGFLGGRRGGSRLIGEPRVIGLAFKAQVMSSAQAWCLAPGMHSMSG